MGGVVCSLVDTIACKNCGKEIRTSSRHWSDDELTYKYYCSDCDIQYQVQYQKEIENVEDGIILHIGVVDSKIVSEEDRLIFPKELPYWATRPFRNMSEFNSACPYCGCFHSIWESKNEPGEYYVPLWCPPIRSAEWEDKTGYLKKVKLHNGDIWDWVKIREKFRSK